MLKIGAVSPNIKLADPALNADKIISSAKKARAAGCSIALFPKFPVTGYSCIKCTAEDSLFNSAFLRTESEKAFNKILEASCNINDMALVLSLPAEVNGRLSVCNQVILNGDVIASSADQDLEFILNGKEYVVSDDERLDELGVIYSRKIILLPTARAYTAGMRRIESIRAKDIYINNIYITSSAGYGESGDDHLYSGNRSFAVNGCLIDSIINFNNELSIFELGEDYDETCDLYKDTYADAGIDEESFFDRKHPFQPHNSKDLSDYCLDILKIQAISICKRLETLNSKNLVLGLSGGLDSTLALIAAVCAFERKGWDKKGINCITMPGFGTGKLTKTNAYKLASALDLELKEIPIDGIIADHLKSIDQPEDTDGNFIRNITYENAQARMRTMILMDYANKLGGIVLGTGDMSELALGWCTYNGDHMSMYSINTGLPKTLISPILETYLEKAADNSNVLALSEAIRSIIDTPVSPELLPADKDGNIVQLTEDKIGPYVLHDFFLHSIVKKGLSPLETYKNANVIFENDFTDKTIKKWLEIFIRRFFSQQFKRSCLPLGPKVLDFSLSPRAGFNMPSDASCEIWLKNLDSGDF